MCNSPILAQTVGFEPTWHCCQIDFECIPRGMHFFCKKSMAAHCKMKMSI